MSWLTGTIASAEHRERAGRPGASSYCPNARAEGFASFHFLPEVVRPRGTPSRSDLAQCRNPCVSYDSCEPQSESPAIAYHRLVAHGPSVAVAWCGPMQPTTDRGWLSLLSSRIARMAAQGTWRAQRLWSLSSPHWSNSTPVRFHHYVPVAVSSASTIDRPGTFNLGAPSKPTGVAQ
jgi:hypothetical protein